MKNLMLMWPALLLASITIAQTNQPVDPKLLPQKGSHYVDQDQIALEGYDVVSYFSKEGPQKGKSKFTVTNDGVKYYFSSKANMNSFTHAPDKYLPMYGGFCAFGLGKTGKKFAIDPETFKIIDDKLYLFFVGPINGKITNSRDVWDRDEEALKAAADKAWETAKRQ
ncbi:MAG: YHS domain-containing (seleno)protein [Cyclobacteriaceae bacterium]